MEETQIFLVHAANLTAHSVNTAYGVERIGSGYRIQIFAWSSIAKSVCLWRLASLDISSSNPPLLRGKQLQRETINLLSTRNHFPFILKNREDMLSRDFHHSLCPFVT